MVLACACSDSVSRPAPPPTLSIASGDVQSALAQTELPQYIVVLLRDGGQRPIAGAAVRWTPAEGARDVIVPLDMATNSEGRARARWQLDTTVGAHTLTVTVSSGATAHARAYASVRPFSAVSPLALETYDGSGEAVHPDFVRLPPSWSGDPFRLVATPYPGGDQSFENPSFFTGSTGASWLVPAGTRNPLESPLSGYYSDPDVLYDPDANELRIYYRRVKDENEIWLIRSANGVQWSAPVLTMHAPNHAIVSPSVVRRAEGDWLMWSVNAGVQGCNGESTVVELRHSTDGVSWSDPAATDLADRDGFAWHIDVEWIPSREEYWAVYPVKQSGSCLTDRLRLATSADGVHWRSYPSPLLVKGADDQMRDIIYRSSIDFDATTGMVSLWYSGASFAGESSRYRWHLAYERMTMLALFARVNVPAWEAARVDAATNLPPLTNETAP